MSSLVFIVLVALAGFGQALLTRFATRSIQGLYTPEEQPLHSSTRVSVDLSRSRGVVTFLPGMFTGTILLLILQLFAFAFPWFVDEPVGDKPDGEVVPVFAQHRLEILSIVCLILPVVSLIALFVQSRSAHFRSGRVEERNQDVLGILQNHLPGNPIVLLTKRMILPAILLSCALDSYMCFITARAEWEYHSAFFRFNMMWFLATFFVLGLAIGLWLQQKPSVLNWLTVKRPSVIWILVLLRIICTGGAMVIMFYMQGVGSLELGIALIALYLVIGMCEGAILPILFGQAQSADVLGENTSREASARYETKYLCDIGACLGLLIGDSLTYITPPWAAL